MQLRDVSTPALIVDASAFDHNVAAMGARWPGRTLRPHVKAFKSTELARRLADAGHPTFCCATVREMVGMAAAGLGDDLLLANESVDAALLAQLGELGHIGAARVTVAVDSRETILAAAAAGIDEVLIDVNVGLPRCGCEPDEAVQLADLARANGLSVRGVMGYEGHIVGVVDRTERETALAESMAVLARVHEAVGGDVVSGGGTGTWDSNTWVTELQAGSFTLMDTAYIQLEVPFRQALSVLGTVVSVNARTGFAVADVGLKALAMDHGMPQMESATVWFCSDEHITFAPPEGVAFADWPIAVGDRVRVWPAHVDPTVAKHERMHVIAEGPPPRAADDRGTPGIDGGIEVVDRWPVDLRWW